MMTNPALAKIMLPFFVGTVAVFALLFLIRSTVGDNPVSLVLTLIAGVAVILVLLVGFNALKKRL
jgi:hypothetical protein